MAREIKLVAFRYSKMSVERNEEFKGELKIAPSIKLNSIEAFKPESAKQEALKVDFKFGIDYNGYGNIELEGKLFLAVDEKTLKEAVDGWKSKKLDNEINMLLLNIIMRKASIKALDLEDQMNLPPHVNIPRLQLGKKK